MSHRWIAVLWGCTLSWVAPSKAAGAAFRSAATTSSHASTATHEGSSTAQSQPFDFRLLSQLSTYERDVAERVLSERHATLEQNPENKWIESVEIEPLDVFTPDDPLPGWVNWFHVTSRAEAIEREVLLRRGQRYSSELAQESARNLRNLRQISLVLALPIKGSSDDRVRILVITKDVWSLRLNSAFRVKNQTIEYLQLQPSEENVLGQHLRLAAQYTYTLATDSYGATLAHQRLFGSHIGLIASLNAIQNRDSRRLEGSTGWFYFGQPLYSSRTRWAWGTSMAWVHRINRYFLPDADGKYEYRRFDDPTTPVNENVPYRYRSHQLGWRTYMTRAYGGTVKRVFTWGLEAKQRKFDAQNLSADGYSADALRRFEEQKLERSTTSLGPYVQFDAYTNQYISLYDVETLGLQEDYTLGPRSFVKVYSGSKQAQSSRDFVGIANGIEYTASLAGSLGRLWALHTAELSPNRSDDDCLLQGGLRLMTSTTPLGRFVYDAGAAYRYVDYRHLVFALGGDNRLRGYPSSQFLGRHLVTSNLEFRTRSLKLFEVLFGLVGFYDVADAFDSPSQFAPKHSVGFGARATAPQLQRVAARLDVAFPLTQPRPALGEQWGGIDVLLTLNGQAFPFPAPVPTSETTPLLPEE